MTTPDSGLADEGGDVAVGNRLACRHATRRVSTHLAPWALPGPILRMPMQDSCAALSNDTKSASCRWRTSDMLTLPRPCGLRPRTASAKSCLETIAALALNASTT